MKAVVFRDHGGLDRLEIADLARPEPGTDEVLLRVRAASLNGFDPMILEGTTGLTTPLPMVPCGDGAGEIVAVGREAAEAGWAEGDRVLIDPVLPERGMMGETAEGTCREYVAVPAGNVLRIPDGVDFETAAALPVAYGTALRMMETRGRVAAGERVLILGATGGVGCCCVQLAKRVGAEVVACGNADWKLDRLRALGADHVVNTRSQDFVAAVREFYGKPSFTGGGGVDVAVNYIGGPTWRNTFRCVGRHGRILVCGATAGYDPPTDLRYLWSFEQTVIGSDGWTRADLESLLRWAAEGSLIPVVHDTKPIDRFAEGMAELMERKVFGKVIIRVTESAGG